MGLRCNWRGSCSHSMRMGGPSVQNLSSDEYNYGRKLGAEGVCTAHVLGEGLNHLENFSKARRAPHTLRCVSGSPLLMGTGAIRRVSQKNAWDATMPERRVSTAPPWLLTSGSDELDKERLVQASKELGSVNRVFLWRPGTSQWRRASGWVSLSTGGCDISPRFIGALCYALDLE